MLFLPSIFILALVARCTFAHSHVDGIWAPNPSVYYPGFDPNTYDTVPYSNKTPGWYTTAQGGRPLYPDSLATEAIICNNGSSPAHTSAVVRAGETLRLNWWEPGPWPSNHKGPVIDYLAPCHGRCHQADATQLRFVKIAHAGWINNSIAEGYWAADQLRLQNSSWDVRIPAFLSPGEYVLRTEIIALHQAFLAVGNGANSSIGAEFYPQCLNLQVTGNGTASVTGGVDARKLYTGAEPGIAYRTLHNSSEHADYVIPGPALWSWAAA
ncbi:hypothetical protein ACEQ8H_002309 [Pleosporales sp. CAS-2024a]